MLQQTILTLYGFEQNWNELRPLPRAIKAGHLSYQNRDLGCYLLGRKKKNRVSKHIQRQTLIQQQVVMSTKLKWNWAQLQSIADQNLLRMYCLQATFKKKQSIPWAHISGVRYMQQLILKTRWFPLAKSKCSQITWKISTFHYLNLWTISQNWFLWLAISEQSFWWIL